MPLPLFFTRILTGGAAARPYIDKVLCKSNKSPQNCVKLWRFFCTPNSALIYQHFFQQVLWKNLWRMWITLG